MSDATGNKPRAGEGEGRGLQLPTSSSPMTTLQGAGIMELSRGP